MTNITNLTTTQLRTIIAIKEQIEALQGQIDSVAGGGEIPIPAAEEAPRKRRRSAAVRARMAAAQQARWAKIKGEAAADSEPSKPAKRAKRRLSAAGRAAISAAAKARWARMRG
jgi:hypothetical protein